MKRQKYEAVLVGKRVIVFDTTMARSLYRNGYYGKPLGLSKVKSLDFDEPLELNILEALYLVRKGILSVRLPNGSILGEKELREHGKKVMRKFDIMYRVYEDLRDRGYVVRSGLKYGAEFAIYEKGPGIDHAPYIVHVVVYTEKIDPLEIVKAGRLSHSVRKKFVLAAVNENSGEIDYIVFSWSKI